jgi:ubiquinone/menaquinone biosynthesis C-methylase UbiE
MIALNATSEREPEGIGTVAEHLQTEGIWSRFQPVLDRLDDFLANDPWQLPATAAREGYYGPRHYFYWLSGARDFIACEEQIQRNGVTPTAVLDMGAATGRVARHFASQLPDAEVWAADINLDHVRWVNRFLGPRVKAFQNSSIPHLPFEDNSFDVVTAFSVFSHIETFDHAWILEVRRILRPGGLFILTANVDNWQDVDETWPVYRGVSGHRTFQQEWLGKPMDVPRRVFRWKAAGSYSSVVFLTDEYVRREWGGLMEVDAIIPYFTQYQSGVVLRKPARRAG